MNFLWDPSLTKFRTFYILEDLTTTLLVSNLQRLCQIGWMLPKGGVASRSVCFLSSLILSSWNLKRKFKPMQSLYAVISFGGNSMLGLMNILSIPASRADRAQTFDVSMLGACIIPQIKKYAIKWQQKNWCKNRCSI